MRRAILAFSVVGAATLVVAAAVLAAALWDRPALDDAEPAPAAVKLAPEQIYPSLALPAIPPGTSYRRLFTHGHSLRTAAQPACRRYLSVHAIWTRRAGFLEESSHGAGVSKRAARAYYAKVVWVSQNEAVDFDDAVSRISRSRLSVVTGRRLERSSLISEFTRDALDLCGLTAAHGRTRQKLKRLDKRISGIIDLARFDAAGLSDGAAQ